MKRALVGGLGKSINFAVTCMGSGPNEVVPHALPPKKYTEATLINLI
jgi:hypothetical protein